MLDFLTIALIVIGVILFISGLFSTICLIRYSDRLRKFSHHLSDDDNPVKSKLRPSIAMTNNYQSESNKKSSIPLSQIPSLLSAEDGNSTSNENFHKIEPHHDFMNFLQHGATLIDRPFGSGLQPLDVMGPNLMKLNTCEQHWIKRRE